MNIHTQLQNIKPILSVLVTKRTEHTENVEKHFGAKLRKWRKAVGLRQEDLAAACGIGTAYVSNIERNISYNKKSGNPTPSEPLVEKFSKVLKVDLDVMREAAGYAPKNLDNFFSGTRLGNLIAAFNQISERDQLILINIAEAFLRLPAAISKDDLIGDRSPVEFDRPLLPPAEELDEEILHPPVGMGVPKAKMIK